MVVGARLLDHPGARHLSSFRIKQGLSSIGAVRSSRRCAATRRRGATVPTTCSSSRARGSCCLILPVARRDARDVPRQASRTWPAPLQLGERGRALPRIETAFLADEEDRKRAREALRWIGRLANTSAIRALAKPIYPSRQPVRRGTASFARRSSRSPAPSYHPCGTAPMGPDGDPLAVTDGRGRVRGRSHGLFVADASLMPTIPTVEHPCADAHDRREDGRVAARRFERAADGVGSCRAAPKVSVDRPAVLLIVSLVSAGCRRYGLGNRRLAEPRDRAWRHEAGRA